MSSSSILEVQYLELNIPTHYKKSTFFIRFTFKDENNHLICVVNSPVTSKSFNHLFSIPLIFLY